MDEQQATGGQQQQRRRRVGVRFEADAALNRRRKRLGLTWRKAAELGVRDQEMAEALRRDRLARMMGTDAASTVSAA